MMYNPMMMQQPMMYPQYQPLMYPAMYQQQQQPALYSQPIIPTADIQKLTRQEKVQKLMHCLQQISQGGASEMQRLLSLIDAELDIITNLLANSTAQVIDLLVLERNQTLKQATGQIAAAYDLIIEIASTGSDDGSDSRLYRYFVRKGKKTQQSQATSAQGKKKFLLRMMAVLQEEYEMIEKMGRVVSQAT